MEKLFKSTRGNQIPIDFYTSILQGIASDGGLLVPDFDFEKKNLEDLLPLNYVDLLQLRLLVHLHQVMQKKHYIQPAIRLMVKVYSVMKWFL